MLGLISAIEEVHVLADIGVILLLFAIGIEFSLENLLRIRRIVLIGGGLQVLISILVTFGLGAVFGLPLPAALFAGMLVAQSSTVVMLRVLSERAELETTHGKSAVGVSIFQDITALPLLISIPVLAGATGTTGPELGILALKILGILAFIYAAARWIVPKFLHLVARTGSSEVFLLSIVFMALATAWITGAIGLPLSLGAFVAGLVVSESEYSHRALGSVLGFRDVFTSFFFISIGMLVEPMVLLSTPLLLFGLFISMFMIKVVAGIAAILLLGFPLKTALAAGLVLSPVGEFAFILSKEGFSYSLLPIELYQLFVAAAVLTMLAAPYAIALAPRIAAVVDRIPLPMRLRRGVYESPEHDHPSDLENHMIVVGLGITGKSVVRAATEALIPYEIIEMNPDTVNAERKQGETIHYGDASHPNVLNHAGIDRARVLVVTLPDAAPTRRVVDLARQMNPAIYIIARTRFVQELDALYALGANEVISEEYEISVEMFARVLRSYLVPHDDIEKFVAELRSSEYEALRDTLEPAETTRYEYHLEGLDVTTFVVASGAVAEGRSLAEMQLRNEHQVTALAVRRADEHLVVPEAKTRFEAGDLVVVAGHPKRLAEVAPLFRAPVKGD